jgi:hypothetical protein
VHLFTMTLSSPRMDYRLEREIHRGIYQGNQGNHEKRVLLTRFEQASSIMWPTAHVLPAPQSNYDVLAKSRFRFSTLRRLFTAVITTLTYCT